MNIQLTVEEVLTSGCQMLIDKYFAKNGYDLLITNMDNIEKFKNIFNNIPNLDINKQYSEMNMKTLLVQACYNNRKEVIEFLVEKEADTNIPEKDGWTPLIHMCYNQYEKDNLFETIKLLIEHRVDVNKKSNSGKTPLSGLSQRRGKMVSETLQLLLDTGAIITKEIIDDATLENKKILLTYHNPLYYGIGVLQKLEISYPEISEKKHNDKYYYVYKMVRRDDGWYLSDQENKRLVLKSLVTDETIEPMAYNFQ